MRKSKTWSTNHHFLAYVVLEDYHDTSSQRKGSNPVASAELIRLNNHAYAVRPHLLVIIGSEVATPPPKLTYLNIPPFFRMKIGLPDNRGTVRYCSFAYIKKSIFSGSSDVYLKSDYQKSVMSSASFFTGTPVCRQMRRSKPLCANQQIIQATEH